MATGLGKTWLAAFDATRPQFRLVLFVAHREEILLQTREVFRQVRPDASVGLVIGEHHDAGADVVLATVQSLSRRLDQIPADRFDYVVIDEFHHAAAPTYRRVVAHLLPAFLLGLTATPDRADKADLLSLCEDNLAFECGLAEGIDRRLLSPFRYLGVPDPVDFVPLPWRNSRFDPQALETAVVTQERAEAALREWQRLAGQRTLAFCVSVRHADFMARVFSEAGIAAVAVHSGPTSAPRHEALFDLARGALRVGGLFGGLRGAGSRGSVGDAPGDSGPELGRVRAGVARRARVSADRGVDVPGWQQPFFGPGRWFAFLLERGYLEGDEAAITGRHAELLATVAGTSMTKSYKMVALRAFAQPAALVVGMPVEELTVRSRRLVLRDPRLLADVRVKELADPEQASLAAWVRWWRKWPLEHMEGSGFRIVGDRFEVRQKVSEVDAPILAELLNELIDWRLARYLQTKGLSAAEGAVVKVIRNASGTPILMLARDRNPDLPEGRGVPVQVDAQWMTFDFMKVAVNIARRTPGAERARRSSPRLVRAGRRRLRNRAPRAAVACIGWLARRADDFDGAN